MHKALFIQFANVLFAHANLLKERVTNMLNLLFRQCLAMCINVLRNNAAVAQNPKESGIVTDMQLYRSAW